MKIRKFASLVCSLAMIITNAAVISVPAASAEENEEEGYSFFEDFESYEEVSDSYSLVDAMNDLYADGWSVATDNAFTARNEDDNNQKFAQVVLDGDNKVLELTTSKALGRMLDPATETPSGSYEISFKFKPVDIGKKQMLFDLSLNSFNETAAVAKHNILYSYNGMKMGHRTNSINVPMTQVGTAEEAWYDVKCVINNDGGYYSVELYKEGEFVARRGAINYAKDEKIGFLKLSGFGTAIYVDDVSIRACEPEMLIYEDDFERYSEVRLPSSYVNVGSSVSEATSRDGDSFFEGYTPWRALKTFGNCYDLVYDKTLESRVVRLGDDITTGSVQEGTGLTLMPLDGELLTKESQAKRGKLKLTYKFMHFSSNGYASAVDIISDYKYAGKWDYPPQVAVQEKGLSRPAVAGLPYLRTNDAPVKINQSLWYDAEVIFDVINDEVTVIVREDSTGVEVAHFTHNTNWINPSTAPTFDKVKGINFRAVQGSAIYIDDVRLEYYITKPEISGNSVIITDYKGEMVTDKKNVPAAVKSIELPFGCEMTEESTNPETVTLTDSKGDILYYSPVYSTSSYTLIPDEFLSPGEVYTLTVPETVENVFGLALGMEMTCSFTVASDYPELMTLAYASAEDLSEIKNGSIMTATIDYVNSLDDPLESMPFIAYYGDDMMLATSSVKPAAIGVGEMGTKTVSFTVPSADVLDLDKVDKISICLWKGFVNSAPYSGELDIEDGDELEFETAQTAETEKSKPVITYSYNDSVLNISGTANEADRYMTVQILYPGNSFETGDELESKKADELVFYRAQVPVINGSYSLDVRFDSVGNTESTLEAGYYPTAIYIDDTKMGTDSVYLSTYSDFEAVCNELNNAAASGDIAGFKNILNTKRAALNFNNALLGDADLGNEIESYYKYVRNNPLNAKNEIQNYEMFNTYVVIEYLNSGKIDNIADSINTLLIADDRKALCNKILTTVEKGKYFTGLISRKAIGDPAQLEKNIDEALILSAAKYGNGYGELKEVLESCGSAIGITAPISATACRELIGKNFSNVSSFKREYDEKAASSGGSSGGGGGGGGGGSSGGSSGASASKKPSVASVGVQVSSVQSGGNEEIKPVRMIFNDIDNYEWAMTGILALADRNIINGVADDRFEPSRNITREEFAKIIVGALGASDSNYKGNLFVDVSDDDWFVKHVNIAAELGIAKGIGDGMFGTGRHITRQDMAVMIYNALQYRNVSMKTDGFMFDDDGLIADYAKPAVAALHSMGAINGVTETTFEPVGFATRAQAAKIIYSVLNELQGQEGDDAL